MICYGTSGEPCECFAECSPTDITSFPDAAFEHTTRYTCPYEMDCKRDGKREGHDPSIITWMLNASRIGEQIVERLCTGNKGKLRECVYMDVCVPKETTTREDLSFLDALTYKRPNGKRCMRDGEDYHGKNRQTAKED